MSFVGGLPAFEWDNEQVASFQAACDEVALASARIAQERARQAPDETTIERWTELRRAAAAVKRHLRGRHAG